MNRFILNLNGKPVEYTQPQVMGIINVTPDSFYDGSRAAGVLDVARRAEKMAHEGAGFIDVGACSTRPGAAVPPPQEEMCRMREALEAIRRTGVQVPLSVDTFRADVARMAVEEYGAAVVNDVSGGSLDSQMWSTVARLRVPYILTHMRGTPADMQSHTDYPRGVTAEVIDDLSRKMRELRLMGVADIIVDPGFGFSKTLEQNYSMMADLEAFGSLLEAPVLVGISRKSMLTRLLDIPAAEALPATTALNTIALTHGAAILRVHDVKEAVQTVKIYLHCI